MTAASPQLLRPDALDEAIAAFAEHGEDARVIAGGQSLVPLMTIGLAAPEVLVSLHRCAELHRLDLDDDNLVISAMATTRRLERDPAVADAFPLLAAAASRVGSPHVRNLGTVVGNVCHADPGGDLIPALLCHDSALRVASSAGERWIPLDELVVGPFMTVIADDELAVEVRVAPVHARGHHAYRKVVKRSGDLALASCAALLDVADGRISAARLSVGGAVARPIRLTASEAALAGTPTAEVTLEAVRDAVLADVTDALLPDKGVPRDYLETMFPRLVAATIRDALGSSR